MGSENSDVEHFKCSRGPHLAMSVVHAGSIWPASHRFPAPASNQSSVRHLTVKTTVVPLLANRVHFFVSWSDQRLA